MKKLILSIVLLLCLTAQGQNYFGPYYQFGLEQKPSAGIPLFHQDSSLVGYWLMNEGAGGVVYDSSGFGNTGALVADTHFVPGKFGPALDFDGTGDYVQKDNPSFANITQGTISAWVKYDVDAGTNPGIVSVGDVDVAATYLSLAIYDSGAGVWLAVQCRVSSTYRYYRYGSTTIQTNQWYHVCVTQDGSGTQLYVNGIAENMNNLLAEAVPSAWFDDVSIDTVRMGTFVSSSTFGFFNGQISDSRTYDRALTASEISKLYNDPFWQHRSPPISFGIGAPPATGNPWYYYSQQ